MFFFKNANISYVDNSAINIGHVLIDRVYVSVVVSLILGYLNNNGGNSKKIISCTYIMDMKRCQGKVGYPFSNLCLQPCLPGCCKT